MWLNNIRLRIIVIALLPILSNCHIFEPERMNEIGRLTITLNFIAHNTTGLQKSEHQSSLDSVRCILFQNTKQILDILLEKQGDQFRGEIELASGSGYRVLVYGIKGDQIAYRGEKEGINIIAGRITEVNMEFMEFQVRLLSPTDKYTSDNKTPNFDWADLQLAMEYHFQLDDDSTFSSPLVDQKKQLTSDFKLESTLSSGVYYWRVNAKDSIGYWGHWSPTWVIIITPAVEWSKVFGGPSNDFGNSLQITSDGGLIIAGYTRSYGKGGTDAWLIKTDASGNKLWDRTFGEADNDRANFVQQTMDNGFIITGSKSIDHKSHYNDLWLIKTDAVGNLIWERTFHHFDKDRGTCVQETNDGGFIISGYTTDAMDEDNALWLIKTDINGYKIWDRIFRGELTAGGEYVVQTVDGGYVVTGYTSYIGGYSNVLLIKTDESGNEIWNKEFDTNAGDGGYCVEQTSDGGFIVVGFTYQGNSDIYLIKTDAYGNELWNRIYGGKYWEEAHFVKETSDGDYIIVGSNQSYRIFCESLWLIKADSYGNYIWSLVLGGDPDFYYQGLSGQESPDGGYIILGEIGSNYNQNSSDIWLIKVK